MPFDGVVAPGGKLSQERRLARTRPAGDDDVTHRYLESTTANGLASAAAFESRAQWSSPVQFRGGYCIQALSCLTTSATASTSTSASSRSLKKTAAAAVLAR